MYILFPSMLFASWRRRRGADDGEEAFTCTPGRRFFLVFLLLFYHLPKLPNSPQGSRGSSHPSNYFLLSVFCFIAKEIESKIFQHRREEFNNNNNNN